MIVAVCVVIFFFSSRRRHTRCALVTGVQTCALPIWTGRSVKDEITQAIATIGENMTLRRARVMTVDGGVVVAYVHSALAEGLGKLGVLVGLKSTGKREVLEQIGKQLAMHIRSEERRVGKECVSTFRSRWWSYN